MSNVSAGSSSLADRLPATVRFIERDWLSSNNILMFDEAGATLVDTGFIKHAPMTEALVSHELAAHGNAALLRIINTHLHSDHCGGNARLVRTFGCKVRVPAGNFDSVVQWDDARMHHGECGQRVERFAADEMASAGDEMVLGGVPWIVLGAPGHDEHSLMLYCPTEQILITADALWETGFGLNFAAFTGATHCLDEQQAVLDVVDPGIGIPPNERPKLVGRVFRGRAATVQRVTLSLLGADFATLTTVKALAAQAA